jgi:hypothetical protein
MLGVLGQRMGDNGRVLLETSSLLQTSFAGIPTHSLEVKCRCLFCVSMFFAARLVSKGRTQAAEIELRERKTGGQAISTA